MLVGVMLLVLFASPSVAGQSTTETKKSCEFVYNAKIESDVVIPTLSSKLGSNYTLFNTAKPAIIQRGPNILLSFKQTFPEKGILPLDTNDFDILLDPCTLRVIDAHLTEPFHLNGTVR